MRGRCKAPAPRARRGSPLRSGGDSPNRSDGQEEEWHDSIVSFWLSPSRLQRQ
jgi:hypothetical protein